MRWALPMMMTVACGGPMAESTALPVAVDLPAEPATMEHVDEAAPSDAALSAARVRVKILENLDAEMRAVLSTEARQFKECYARALDRNPELAGSMTVDVALERGRPSGDSAIQVDDTGDWRLVACVEQAVQHWAVPGARAEQVAFVLEFSSRRG